MLGLTLRKEFSGRRLSGTMIDFTNRHGTGALDRTPKEFLNITYPSIDLLKTIEAVQPGKAKPVVIIGSRGQGKSHLMATISHMFKDPAAGKEWINEWGGRIANASLENISLDTDMHVIAESLHLQKNKFLWDLLFENHPNGTYIQGKWEGQGDKKTDIPSYDLILELLQKQPVVLILDEFQTWYEGLTNTKQYPWRTWAFNFIQILSEISLNNPELLSLIVSVRDGDSDAAQQIYRVDPVRVDFKGPEAKRDRKRLLLFRIFENRTNISSTEIEQLIKQHFKEYFRLYHIPPTEHVKHLEDFVESWPFSPQLMQLLDDQVLIATDTQETRDLLRILVDVFKMAGKNHPIITAADFSIINEKSGIASLLDSVANELHRNLRDKAIRNFEAVQEATRGSDQPISHLEEIISSLWLRSLTLENMAGAEPHELQLDITRGEAIDDNRFNAELATIEENSFNIHRKGNHLVFLNEENPQAKLMAHAKNDRLFEKNEDKAHLANEIKYVLAGADANSQSYKIIALTHNWNTNPWSDIEERDQPQNWDNRIPVIIIPSGNVTDSELGGWLKTHISKNRNTVRFLLPEKNSGNIFYDKEILVTARAVYLANQWKQQDANYSKLHIKYQKELRDRLRNHFDRFALLETWNFAEPEKCTFLTTSHNTEGIKILSHMQDLVRRELFIPEEFSGLVIERSKTNKSVTQVLTELKEPMSGGQPSIPWLGETEAKEQIIRLCAQGRIAINVLGREMLERHAGETEDDAWHRMKGRLGSGRQLEETTLHEPGTTISSSGGAISDEGEKRPPVPGSSEATPPGGSPVPNIFSGGGERSRCATEPTSSLSLLGKIEGWGINSGSQIYDCKLSIGHLTGSQLQELLKKLPDGVTYGLDLEKE
jgi:uncharacterized protein DUF499